MVFDWNIAAGVGGVVVALGTALHAHGAKRRENAAKKREQKLQQVVDNNAKLATELKQKKIADQEEIKSNLRLIDKRLDDVEDNQLLIQKDLKITKEKAKGATLSEKIKAIKKRLDTVGDNQLLFGKDLAGIEKIEQCVLILKKDIQSYKLQAARDFMQKTEYQTALGKIETKIEQLNDTVTNCRCGKSN